MAYTPAYPINLTLNKTADEILKTMPMYFCEVGNKYHSWRVIGISRTGYIVTRTESDGYGINVYYLEVPFLDDKLFVASEDATPKQKRWLNTYHYNPNVGGVEAWHIINDAVEYAKKINKREPDDEDYIYNIQCGDYEPWWDEIPNQ